MIQSALLFETVEEIYRRVFRELKPRTPMPEIVVLYKPYVHMDSKIELNDERTHIEVRISDQLEKAPAPVAEALAHILLSKLYKKPIGRQYERRYRLYTERADVRERSRIIKGQRGRKQISSPKGLYFDLEEIFNELNERFFENGLAQPRLTWSPRRSRRTLGHWDVAHNTIVISRIFDHPAVPRYLVEYILYHEMLHIKHPVEHCDGRRRVHTKAFNEEERKFPRYKEANALIKRL